MIPLDAGWVIADINVGILYIFAISSLGVYGVIMGGWASNSKYAVPRRAALGGADGVLRGLDRLRHHHRAALRRLAEPHATSSRRRTRRCGLSRLVLAAAVPDVRDLLHLGAGRDQPRRRSTCRRRSRSSSPAIMVEYSSTPYLLFMLGEYVAHDPDVRDDHDPVLRRLAVADHVRAVHLGAGRHLVRAQDRASCSSCSRW